MQDPSLFTERYEDLIQFLEVPENWAVTEKEPKKFGSVNQELEESQFLLVLKSRVKSWMLTM